MPVYTLASHAYLLPLLHHHRARLCMRVHGCVSLCFHLLPSCSQTPSPFRRLNSRDRIRTKLSAQSENGPIITPIRFMPDPNPAGNSADNVTSIVARVVDQSTSESDITLPKVGPL